MNKQKTCLVFLLTALFLRCEVVLGHSGSVEEVQLPAFPASAKIGTAFEVDWKEIGENLSGYFTLGNKDITVNDKMIARMTFYLINSDFKHVSICFAEGTSQEELVDMINGEFGDNYYIGIFRFSSG